MSKFSTPLIGRNTILPDLPWSEIRVDAETGRKRRINSTPVIEVTEAKQQRRKLNGDNFQTATTNDDDFDTSSDYETISEFETDIEDSYCQNIYQTFKSRNNSPNTFHTTDKTLQHDRSSASPKPLFYSSGERKYDNYEKSYLNSEANRVLGTKSLFDHPIDDMDPESEFEGSQELKTYPSHCVGKKKQIPSLKCKNKIAPKFNSPSNIPSREDTLRAGNTSTTETGWGSRFLCQRAEELWEDFIGSNIAKKQMPTKRPVNGQSDVEYSYLRANDKKFEIIKSPNRNLGTTSPKQAYGLLKPLQERTSPYFNSRTEISPRVSPSLSKSVIKRRIRLSQEYDTTASQEQSKQNSEFDIGTPVNTETETRSRRKKKKLKPKVLSVELLKSPIKFYQP